MSCVNFRVDAGCIVHLTLETVFHPDIQQREESLKCEAQRSIFDDI